MNRIVEYVFFFGCMALAVYWMWKILAPFVSALALAAIIVTICYPLYEWITQRLPKQNQTLGALISTAVVVVVVVIPIIILTSILVDEVVSTYNQVSSEGYGLEQKVKDFEARVSAYVPNFELNVVGVLEQATEWLKDHSGKILASTASTVFAFFIAIIGVFYLFRDGRAFTKKLVLISPLPDTEDELILRRLATAVRSVATGTVLIALIQGSLAAFGLWLFGFERFVLWGVIAAFGALIPGVGTTIVLVPAVVYLFLESQIWAAVGLAAWGVLAVGLIDNLLGPYLISRGNNLHPYMILLSVLGGVLLLGPVGFVVGPVVLSLLLVLLELYATHIAQNQSPTNVNGNNPTKPTNKQTTPNVQQVTITTTEYYDK